jgi:hypothetical protein
MDIDLLVYNAAKCLYVNDGGSLLNSLSSDLIVFIYTYVLFLRVFKFDSFINVAENRRGNQESTIQRN